MTELPFAHGDDLLGFSQRLMVQSQVRLPEFPDHTLRKLSLMKDAHAQVRDALRAKGLNRKQRRMLKKSMSRHAAGWRALRQNVASQMALTGDLFADTREAAQKIWDRLFFAGLEFLKGDANDVWQQAEHRLHRVRNELEPVFNQIGAYPHYQMVLRVHRDLGDEIAVIGAPELITTPDTNLGGLYTLLRYRMRMYTMSVIIWADDLPDGEEAIAVLLKPIFDRRAALAREKADKAKADASEVERAKAKAEKAEARAEKARAAAQAVQAKAEAQAQTANDRGDAEKAQ